MSGAWWEAVLLALVNSAQVIMLAYITRRTNQVEKRRVNGGHDQEEHADPSAPQLVER